MKLLVAGSRSIKDFNLEGYIPDGVELIITGGACGVDALAEEYADRKRLSKLILRPQYRLYGKAAPLKRNEKMIELCDAVLIVWDGMSKGTNYTITYAKKMSKDITVVKVAPRLR